MKKSFILYTDTLAVLDTLTDEQAGQLFRAIKSYHETGESGLHGMFISIFSPFKVQFERDGAKYQKRCEANKSNGLMGGRPKPNQTQSNPVGYSRTQSNPIKPDSDSDNDNKKNKELPDWLPLDDWKDFIEMRKAIKKPMTDRASQMIIAKLEGYKSDVSKILQQSIINNWQDVYELKQIQNSFAKPKPQKANVRTLGGRNEH
jgi:hypothetical protein